MLGRSFLKLLLISLGLTGCESLCGSRGVTEVKIPITAPCTPPPPIEPVVDPISGLTPDKPTDELVKILRASRVIWRDRALQLETLINKAYGGNNVRR